MLRVARRIGQVRPIDVHTSFLGAHAVPPEYQGKPDAYIDDVCIPTLRAAHAEGLVDAVDGFCEGIAFDSDGCQSPRQFRHRRRCSAWRILHPARDTGTPDPIVPRRLCADGIGHRLQSRFIAADLAPADHEHGPDARADLCIWDVTHPAELSYRIGFNPLHKRIFRGSL